ncbi:transcriptional regulator domain-containing protein [Brevundimonas faecalis]|jgi:hypothetical protein|uniref:transcriptional regulator domain-containing protein n=1 Tax=Brevundimonas TaxID=41275 RepID=UPI003606D4E8
MSEDESWRSEAAYDYIDALTPGDLAWEFLRRNPDYRKSYSELVAVGRLTESTAREFAAKWGLRFRRRPTQLSAHPADILDPPSRSGSDRPDDRPRTRGSRVHR